jgi:very-short-patch-repair endonuclease
VDFYAPKVQLVIEVDGMQHFESENMKYDESRSIYLNSLGLQILRFSNLQILQEIDNVTDFIFRTVEEKLNK